MLNYKNIKNSSQLKRLKKYAYLWHASWESVARGVAVGLFTGIVPLVSFQTLMAIGLSILIRANLPIALLVSWISNPLTILPLAYFTYYVGDWVLGHSYPSQAIHLNWPININNMQMLWSTFGIPFLVGLPIVAIGAAILGYLIVRFTGFLSDHFKFFKQK